MAILDTGFADLKTVVKLEDGNLITGTVQDCTAIAERTKAMHNSGMHSTGDMRLVASIPMVMVEKYLNDNGIDYAEFSRNPVHKSRLINNPDLSHFRVWGGRL